MKGIRRSELGASSERIVCFGGRRHRGRGARGSERDRGPLRERLAGH